MISRRHSLIGAGALAAALMSSRSRAKTFVPAIVSDTTAVTGFVGQTSKGPVGQAITIDRVTDFVSQFGPLDADVPLSLAVRDFFLNGGHQAVVMRLPTAAAASDYSAALDALAKSNPVNLLCLPAPSATADTDPAAWRLAEAWCGAQRAFLLVDPPLAWTSAAEAQSGLAALGLGESPNAALYFPRLRSSAAPKGKTDTVAPCGAVAGMMAHTDDVGYVWRAPAGMGTVLNGVSGVAVGLSDSEMADLNALGIDCLRTDAHFGTVIWGARTLAAAGRNGSVFKYISARRTALLIERSLQNGLEWAALQPNTEATWSYIRLTVSAYLEQLYRQGALQGATPDSAFFVKCGADTTTQAEIDNGYVNLVVGLALVMPAEFVDVTIQLRCGS